jgi:flagellar hook-length control protein FliK
LSALVSERNKKAQIKQIKREEKVLTGGTKDKDILHVQPSASKQAIETNLMDTSAMATDSDNSATFQKRASLSALSRALQAHMATLAVGYTVVWDKVVESCRTVLV